MISFASFLKGKITDPECKLKQVTIARELGVSNNAVSKWVAGQSLPDKKHIQKLAILLGVDPSELTVLMDGHGVGKVKKPKKNKYVIESPWDISEYFSTWERLEGKSYRVLCTESYINDFLSNYGNDVKLLYPEEKKANIIKNRFPGYNAYNTDDLLDFFLKTGFREYDLFAIAEKNNIFDHDGDKVLKSVILRKYVKILNYARVDTILNKRREEEFNDCHRNLCEDLTQGEKDIIGYDLFSGDYEYKSEFKYFNAQYVLNYVLHKMYEYGNETYATSPEFLHSVISNKNGLDSYENYLELQQKAKDTAAELGLGSRYVYDKKRIGRRDNVIDYRTYDEFEEYVNSLDENEKVKELYVCVNLSIHISVLYGNLKKYLKGFLNSNFYLGTNIEINSSPDFFNHILYSDNVDYNEKIEMLRKKLEVLQNNLISPLKDFASKLLTERNESKIKDFVLPNDVTGEILSYWKRLNDVSENGKGSYVRFIGIVNDLESHICSWYWHLFGEEIDKDLAYQTVKSDETRRLLIAYKDKSDKVSPVGTAEIIKKELQEIIRKIS